MDEFKCHIAALNGYLHSLRRFRGAGYFYAASSYVVAEDIDSFLIATIKGWGGFEYRGKSLIEFNVLSERLESIIFGGALSLSHMSDESRKCIKQSVLEDINEYYGLAATSLGTDEPFHPLISGPVYELDVESESYSDLFMYVVQIGSNYVLTSFARKFR